MTPYGQPDRKNTVFFFLTTPLFLEERVKIFKVFQRYVYGIRIQGIVKNQGFPYKYNRFFYLNINGNAGRRKTFSYNLTLGKIKNNPW